MAPQVPESVVTNNQTEDKASSVVVATEAELKAAAENAAAVAKKFDGMQRAQTDRKRGWHDYQFLLSGHSGVADTVCNMPVAGNTYDEDGINGWNSFNVNGENQIVNFVTAPPSYGRFPNYKATDRAIQATDGAILVIQPSPWLDNIDYSFNEVKNAYEGKNVASYNDMWGVDSGPVSAPSEKELAAMKERKKRPVAIVILNSTEGFYVHANYRSYEESLKALRKACATFMKDYGDVNNVRLYEITNLNDKETLNKVVTLMVSDLQEGNGIEFVPPEVRPWEENKTNKQFDTLSLKKKSSKRSTNRTGFWGKFTKLITGH